MDTPARDEALRRALFVPFQRDEIEQSIPHRFERVARAHASRLAVRTGDRALTYDELNRQANRIACAIRLRCPAPPQAIVLLVEQGPALIAATLGVLKSGHFYVPLDRSHPLPRIQAMSVDATARLVVTDDAHLDLANGVHDAGLQIMNLADAEDQPDEDPGVIIEPGAIAYVYYTSGSTGQPKGVMDTHRNVLHNIMRYTNSLRISPDDRLTLLQSASFSGAVSSTFAALLNGAAVFPLDLTRTSSSRLADYLSCERITVYHSVPAIFRSILSGERRFPDIRLVRLEGDQAWRVDVELFRKHFRPDCVLVNGLGATETGIIRQYFVDRDTPLPSGAVPIGHAVQDMTVTIVDDAGQALEQGVIGEIAVRSRFLSPGYWHSPDLTARAFSVDVAGGAERTYRTGDLGRMRADGCLEHLGRKDSRVKIRGQTVEVAEVEAALTQLPSIEQAVVVARERTPADLRLVAYLAPDPGPLLRPSVSDLRRHLEARLARSSIPASYVWLDALPLNANRKVDRRALPPPGRSRPELQTDYLAPHDALQDQISRTWEDLLGVSPVGIHDDFMELGGDSLLAIRMLIEVERNCGIATESPALLEAATVERLSAALLARQDGATAPVVAVQPGGTKPPLFFLHGDYLTGGLFCLGLARELGPDQPFFALTPCGVGGESVPATVQAMAARHLEALRSVQPKGPYRLVGNCNGGLMALEMARRLVAEGEEVPVLAMVRTSAANARYQKLASVVNKLGVLLRLGLASETRLVAHLRWYFDAMRQASPSERASITADKLRKVIVAATRRGLPESLENLTNCLPESPANRRGRLADTYMRLAAEYVPARYSGPATVFWPVEDDESPDEAERAWRQVVGRLDFQVVPGTHLSYVTRHVGEFAHRLQECLQAEVGSVR